jgi:hypothetical protein
MLLLNVFFAVLASVITATFRVRDLVVTSGLQTSHYENRIAVVVGDAVLDEQGQTRFPVVLWMGVHNTKGPFSLRKAIKTENLTDFQTYALSRPEAVFSGTNQRQVANLDACGTLIFGLGPVESLLDEGMTECKARLIGGAIFMEAGHGGMVHVAETKRSYTRTLEHVWNYVGRFLA